MQQMQQMQQIQQMQKYKEQQEIIKKQELEKQELENSKKTENIKLNQETIDVDISDIVDKMINEENQIDDSISLVSDNCNNFTKTKLLKLNVDKLKNICETNNLSNEGIKGVLIDRILAAEL